MPFQAFFCNKGSLKSKKTQTTNKQIKNPNPSQIHQKHASKKFSLSFLWKFDIFYFHPNKRLEKSVDQQEMTHSHAV